MTNITKISYFRLLIFILALQITNNIALAEPLKVAVLKFGTVNWELNVIKEHGLDKKRNIDILIDLAEGDKEFTVWTSDLTEEYIKINLFL